MRLFDSSAIINLCAGEKLEPLLEGCTLSLTLYEIGNAVWKQAFIQKAITVEEAEIILDSLASIFWKMKKIEIKNPLEVLKVAINERITYYDASYLQAAIENNLTLVTDDHKLYKIGKKHVKTIKSDEV